MTVLVAASVVAKACGVRQPSTVLEWARKGIIPFVPHGKQVRFDLAAVRSALRAHAERPTPTMKACTACGRDLPIDQFRAKKNGGGPTGRSSDCNECHKAYNASLRRNEAVSKGRVYRTRDDIDRARATREAQEESDRKAREASRDAERAAKVERAREFLAQEAQRARQAAEAAKKPMPHARPVDDDMIRFVNRDVFWSKTRRADGDDGCWEWTGQRKRSSRDAKDSPGYGRAAVHVNGKLFNVSAHRLAWTLANGPIPAGKCVLHRCDNPPCINPGHLFLGKPADNSADMKSKGRQPCPPGTIPAQFVAFMSSWNGRVPGGRAEINAEKMTCPKCGGPLMASKHASQGGRRRCPTCTRAHAAEHRAEWRRRHEAKRVVSRQA